MSFLNSRFCSCPSSKFNNISENSELKDLLPASYDYNLCDIEKVKDGFIVRFRINIRKKETAKKWLEEFAFCSNTKYRTDKIFPENTVGNVYKVAKYCHHRSKTTKEMKKRSKNTNCPSRLVLTVKKTQLYRNNESKDVHLQSFPAIVVLRHVHNHPLQSAQKYEFVTLSAVHQEAEEIRDQNEEPHSNQLSTSNCPTVVVLRNEHNHPLKSAQKYEVVTLPAVHQEAEEIRVQNEEPYSNKLPISNYPNIPVVENAIKDFENVTKEIIQKVQNDASMFEAFQKFLKNYHNIKTKSELQSALATFGKHSDFDLGENIRLCSSKSIGVQTAAFAKRKTKIRGLQSLQSGRPPKQAHTSEHGYAAEKSTENSLVPKRLKK